MKKVTNINTDIVSPVNTNANRSIIEEFIRKYDHIFIPPISIQKNINEYVLKVFTYGHFLMYIQRSNIRGLIGFYCNDTKFRVGYISYLAIDKDYRRKGIGQVLLDECMAMCLNQGMRVVRLQTWSGNTGALSLYINKDFRFVENYVDKFDVEKTVLERKLI